MTSHHQQHGERAQLDLFRALPGDLAPRDAQDLMAYPFFSLAQTEKQTFAEMPEVDAVLGNEEKLKSASYRVIRNFAGREAIELGEGLVSANQQGALPSGRWTMVKRSLR